MDLGPDARGPGSDPSGTLEFRFDAGISHERRSSRRAGGREPAGSSCATSPGRMVATTAFTLGPSEWRQQSLSGWFGTPGAATGSRVDLAVETGAADAYASVIDNVTGDAVRRSGASEARRRAPFRRSPSFRFPRPPSPPGTAVTLLLSAGGATSVRLEPGGLVPGAGGAVTVAPSVTTTYRLLRGERLRNRHGGRHARGRNRAGRRHDRKRRRPRHDPAALPSTGGFRTPRPRSGRCASGLPSPRTPGTPCATRPPSETSARSSAIRAGRRSGGLLSSERLGARDASSRARSRSLLDPRRGKRAGRRLSRGLRRAGLRGADGLVVVTLNYRLGALGLLAHPSLTGKARAACRGITASSTRSRHSGGCAATSRLSAAIPRASSSPASRRGRGRVLARGLAAREGALRTRPDGKRRLLPADALFGGDIRPDHRPGRGLRGCDRRSPVPACPQRRSAHVRGAAAVERVLELGQVYGPNVDGFALDASPLSVLLGRRAASRAVPHRGERGRDGSRRPRPSDGRRLPGGHPRAVRRASRPASPRAVPVERVPFAREG